MEINDNIGHIFDSDLSSLIDKVQTGELSAEGLLFQKIEPLILRVTCKWFNADADDPDVKDAFQNIQFHLLEKLRQPGKIDNPKAYIWKLAENVLKNVYAKERAQKRGAGEVGQILENVETAKDSPALGEKSVDPATVVEQMEWTIKAQYMRLPSDLRTGIEKSLDLIADLFRVREKLKRKIYINKSLYKKFIALSNAREILENEFHLKRELKENDFRRFSDLYMELSLFSADKTLKTVPKLEEIINEIICVKKKFGPIYSILETMDVCGMEIFTGSSFPFLFYTTLWGENLFKIKKMRISSENIIYEVWSRAPGFRIGKSSKYRSRKRIALSFQYHKRVSKGTPREILFRSVREANLKDLEKSVERFRKTGYGQPLKEKYAPIIDLIASRSFNLPSTFNQKRR